MSNYDMQTYQQPPKQPLSAYLTGKAVSARINSMVGSKEGPQFISALVSAVSVNPALATCENTSLLSAALLGHSMKLSPSPQLGHYYMVPFKQKEKKDRAGNIITPETTVAQFQIGYKGYIQLAIRSGFYTKLNVLAIKEGELIRFDPLNEEIEVKLIDDEEKREKARTVGYYAMFEYTNGFRKAIYWSKAKMIAHADRYSQAFSKDAITGTYPNKCKVSFADYEAGKYPPQDEWKYSSFWYKDFDGMAYKTMLRQLISKWGIMSIEMQSAYTNDMGAINEDGSVSYVDNSDAYDSNIISAQNVQDAPESGEMLPEGEYTYDSNKTAENGSEPAEVVSLNDI